MNLYVTAILDFAYDECFVSCKIWRTPEEAVTWAIRNLESYGFDASPHRASMLQDLVTFDHTEVFTPDMKAMAVIERDIV